MVDTGAFESRVAALSRVLAGAGQVDRSAGLVVVGEPVRGIVDAWCGDRAPVGSWDGGTVRIATLDGGPPRFLFTVAERGTPALDASIPVRVFATLGTGRVSVTASGRAVSQRLAASPWMAVSDHLNLTGDNPLVGPNHEAWGVRFPDMSEPYDPASRRAAADRGVPDGILAEFPETGGALSDERLRLASALGADAVGSGVVPLAIAAAHAGLAFSAILALGNAPGNAPGSEAGSAAIRAITDLILAMAHPS